MNFELASLDFQARQRANGYRESVVSEMVAQGIASYNTARPILESPIEEYLLPWLIFSDFPPFSVAPAPVFRPSEDSLASGRPLIIVPQLAIGRYRLDFAVVARRPDTSIIIAVECDGAAFHDQLNDRRRDAYLAAFRIPVVRATGKDIREKPAQVVERVARLVEAWSTR